MFTMILSNFFNTKFIVRISGYPRLHFLENFWKNFSNKIYAVICPTKSTKKLLSEKKILKKIKYIW